MAQQRGLFTDVQRSFFNNNKKIYAPPIRVSTAAPTIVERSEPPQIIISATPPVDPAVNQLWIDIS